MVNVRFLSTVLETVVLQWNTSEPLILGRGPKIGCQDKRVSRRHAELKYSEEENCIVLNPLHTNPCFRLAEGIPPIQIIKQGMEVKLYHGDFFGLIPQDGWLKILIENEKVNNITKEPKASRILEKPPLLTSSPLKNTVQLLEFTENNVNNADSVVPSEPFACDVPQKKPRLEHTPVQCSDEVTSVKSKNNTGIGDPVVLTSEQEVNQSPNVRNEASKIRKLPSWMYQEDVNSNIKSDKTLPTASTDPIINSSVGGNIIAIAAPSLNINRNHDDGEAVPELIPPSQSMLENQFQSSEEVTKQLVESGDLSCTSPILSIGTENPQTSVSSVTAASENSSGEQPNCQPRTSVANSSIAMLNVEVKTEPGSILPTAAVNSESSTGISNSSALASTTIVKTEPGTANSLNNINSPLAAPPRRRPLCQYEGLCYRRNPLHKSDYSHPGDDDWLTPEARPLCPFDPNCYRMSKDHRANNRHTGSSNYRRNVSISLEGVSNYSSDASELEFGSSVEDSDDEDAFFVDADDFDDDDFLPNNSDDEE